MEKQDPVNPLTKIQKAREYLEESQRNLARLQNGKGVKRKFRFLLQENKMLVMLISVILILSIVLPIVFLWPEPIIRDPIQDQVDTTINLISTNFTDIAGYPIINETLNTPSSELLILSSLTYSLIAQAGFEHNHEDFQNRIVQIVNALENNTFVSYENRSEPLSIYYQFLGVYALLQSHFTLPPQSEYITQFRIQEVLTKILDNYLTSFQDPYEYPYQRTIIEPLSNSSYLIDQALAIWVVSTYQLLTGNSWVSGWHLESVIEDILNYVSTTMFNSTTYFLFQEYDHSTNQSKNYAEAEDLIFFTIGLSKAERLHAYFERSSSNIHQQIINDFMDDDWLIHSYNSFDSEIYMKNQAFFTLISYLMNLQNTGVEAHAQIINSFTLNSGFIEKIGETAISGESCFYGLMGLSSKNWSYIENDREALYSGPTAATSSPLMTYITTLIVFVIFLSRRRILRKRKW